MADIKSESLAGFELECMAGFIGIRSVANADTIRGPLYSDHSLILPAARQGHGIALGELLFIKDDLAAGRLVAPFDSYVHFGNYWLMAANFETLSPPAKAFSNWLQDTIQQSLPPS